MPKAATLSKLARTRAANINRDRILAETVIPNLVADGRGLIVYAPTFARARAAVKMIPPDFITRMGRIQIRSARLLCLEMKGIVTSFS